MGKVKELYMSLREEVEEEFFWSHGCYPSEEVVRLIATEKFNQITKTRKSTVYLDMDGVIANFAKAAGIEPGTWIGDPPAMFERGFFRNLEVMPYAREAVTKLLTYRYVDLCIATKHTVKNIWCATEKLQWLQELFPELYKTAILIPEKGRLIGDYLIDDDTRWEATFQGEYIRFLETDPKGSWDRVFQKLDHLK